MMSNTWPTQRIDQKKWAAEAEKYKLQEFWMPNSFDEVVDAVLFANGIKKTVVSEGHNAWDHVTSTELPRKIP